MSCRTRLCDALLAACARDEYPSRVRTAYPWPLLDWILPLRFAALVGSGRGKGPTYPWAVALRLLLLSYYNKPPIIALVCSFPRHRRSSHGLALSRLMPVIRRRRTQATGMPVALLYLVTPFQYFLGGSRPDLFSITNRH